MAINWSTPSSLSLLWHTRVIIHLTTRGYYSTSMKVDDLSIQFTGLVLRGKRTTHVSAHVCNPIIQLYAGFHLLLLVSKQTEVLT